MTDCTTAWINAAGKRKLTPEQTQDLFVDLRNYKAAGNDKAYNKTLNRICEGNLLLVVSTVNRYAKKTRRFRIDSNSELFQDLLQVGYLGLRVAAERFDLTRGNRFSTCAVPWIGQRLGRHLIQNEQEIYIPEGTIQELHYYLKNGKGSGRKSAPKGIAYINAAASAYYVGSIDVKIGTDEDSTFLSEMLSAPSAEEAPRSPDEAVLILRDKMAQAMIGPREQDLLLAYARKGRIDTAAASVKYPLPKARKEIKVVIAKLQELA